MLKLAPIADFHGSSPVVKYSKNIIIANFDLQDIYLKLFVYICYIAIVYFFVRAIVRL